MIVLTVNSGSTSIKLALYEAASSGAVRRISHDQQSGKQFAHKEVLGAFLKENRGQPDAIAHRIVHGGTRFPRPVLIDPEIHRQIQELAELAPLHNPQALQWMDAARELLPGTAQVAAFDTSFFAQLPRIAAEYALPLHYGVDQGVRRYGFHGLAHQALWQRWSALNPDIAHGGRLISLQLGGGCSAAAIERGQPLDTTMGFSPLEGLVMGTRSGDIDPAVVPYLQRRLAMTSDEIIDLLNHESGVSGMSGGITDLGALAADPAPQSQFAVGLYCYRLRKAIGAYLTVLGGCDGIVFGGGVGEHVPAVRNRVLAAMEWAGIELDATANEAARGAEARIDSSRGQVRVYVVPAEEEAVLVSAARALVKEA
jgi:acetate kinase